MIMSRTYAIILAGGKGIRLNAPTPKQFLPLGGRPVLLWSLEAFNAVKEIDHILAVIHPDWISLANEILASRHIDKLLKIIPGGSTRQGSAYRALESCDFDDDDILLFHDAARPFIGTEIILKCLAEITRSGAAGVYVPSRDTIAFIDEGMVKSIPSREKTFCAQTPQGFRYSIIKNAHEEALQSGIPATDDIGLAINAGAAVTYIEGDYDNFKITTDLDYKLACFLAENRRQDNQTIEGLNQ